MRQVLRAIALATLGALGAIAGVSSVALGVNIGLATFYSRPIQQPSRPNWEVPIWRASSTDRANVLLPYTYSKPKK